MFVLPAEPFGVFFPSTCNLSVGTRGMPRQVRNGVPNKVDRWRRNAAASAFAAERGDRARVREEEGRLLPNFGEKFVEIVGSRGAFARLDALRRGDVIEQAVVGVVDELVFLIFFDVFDVEAQLFADLIEGIGVNVGDARVDVDDGGDAAEGVLAGFRVIVDVGVGERFLVFLTTDDVGSGIIDDAVHAEGACFERLPVEQANEPAGSDRTVLRRSFGDVGELKGGAVAQGVMCGVWHRDSPLANTKIKKAAPRWKRPGKRE